MAVIGIDTDAIVQGGRTFMSRNLVKVARHETFGLGKCNIDYDKLFKILLITKSLTRDNNYTQEEIQCLESELLGEIQSQENLQATILTSGAIAAGGAVATSGGVDISTPEIEPEPGEEAGRGG